VQEIAGGHSFTHGELRPGRYLSIVVRDAGRGMDGVVLARIFEPFFTTRSTGNGLGLATVREIVREHGGAMNVLSTPGVGTRFEVWLPCLATATPAPELDAPMHPRGLGETVLLAANDSARLLRDEEMLAALGYEAVGFISADMALAACRAAPERFDALVVGHLGSARSSLELAAALHEAAPHLPIVLATKSTEEVCADSLMFAGIADVVQWPIVAAEIAAALNRCSQLTGPEAKPPPNSSRGPYWLAH
jgi:CheY-like chemotaxis protein